MTQPRQRNGRYSTDSPSDQRRIVSLRCDERLVREIDAAAAADGQTRSEWLLDAVSQHLES